MKFSIKQKINVRRNQRTLGDKPIPLREWVTHHNFVGEVLAINESTIEVCKIDSKSLYGKGEDKEVFLINTDSGEYDLTPLRVDPLFQTETRAIHMAI